MTPERCHRIANFYSNPMWLGSSEDEMVVPTVQLLVTICRHLKVSGWDLPAWRLWDPEKYLSTAGMLGVFLELHGSAHRIPACVFIYTNAPQHRWSSHRNAHNKICSPLERFYSKTYNSIFCPWYRTTMSGNAYMYHLLLIVWFARCNSMQCYL